MNSNRSADELRLQCTYYRSIHGSGKFEAAEPALHDLEQSTTERPQASAAVTSKARAALLDFSRAQWANLKSADTGVAGEVLAVDSKTPQHVIDATLAKLNLQPHETIMDLGCGNARWLVSAVKQFGCSGVGIEILPALVEESNKAVSDAKLSDKIKIIHQDVMSIDLTGIHPSVIVCFMGIEANKQLAPALSAAISRGATVVSPGFHVPGCAARHVVHSRGYKVYVYDTAHITPVPKRDVTASPDQAGWHRAHDLLNCFDERLVSLSHIVNYLTLANPQFGATGVLPDNHAKGDALGVVSEQMGATGVTKKEMGGTAVTPAADCSKLDEIQDSKPPKEGGCCVVQ